MMALVQRKLNFYFKILALQLSLIYCKIRVIIHVCDKKKSILPYLKPCMTSNFSKSKTKTLFMRISTIRCIGLFSNRERLRRGEKKAYGGCFFISYSRHSPSTSFTIIKPFIFGKPSESLFRRLTTFIKPFFRIIFLIRKKKKA